MRTIRIFQTEQPQLNQEYTLTSEAGQHVGVVLRMQPGEYLTIFTGNDHEYQAIIQTVHKKRVTVHIEAVKKVSKESPLQIHLVQGISKGERMEIIVQKAVELGVSSIRPLISSHCVVKLDKERLSKKVAQWQAIAVAACEQCGRNLVPKILEPLSLSLYLKNCTSKLRLVLNPEGSKRWQDYDLKTDNMDILIGPEGGFSSQELQEIEIHGFSSIKLGPRILRTETAAIAMLSILQAVAGDF